MCRERFSTQLAHYAGLSNRTISNSRDCCILRVPSKSFAARLARCGPGGTEISAPGPAWAAGCRFSGVIRYSVPDPREVVASALTDAQMRSRRWPKTLRDLHNVQFPRGLAVQTH